MSEEVTITRRDALKGFTAAGAAGLIPAATPAAFAGTVGGNNGGQSFLEVDPSWPKPLPRDPETGEYWVTGDVAGTAIDSHDRLYTINRRNLTDNEQRGATPSPAFIVYDTEGNVVDWATPPVLPDSLHGLVVDAQGDVWVGGNSDAIVQKYSPDMKKLLLQIGEKGVFDSTDRSIDGVPLNRSHTLLNKPADIAVDPDNGDVYIADGYGNQRIVVFDRNGNYLRQWGGLATLAEARNGVGGQFLGVVHGVNLGHDGRVYVNDRKGNRIQVFEKSGEFVRNYWVKEEALSSYNPDVIGHSWDLAFSRDRQQQFMYVTDGEDQRVWTLNKDGRAVAKYGQPGHSAGDFTYAHTLATDSKGNLYTGETVGGRRAQRFRIARQRDEHIHGR